MIYDEKHLASFTTFEDVYDHHQRFQVPSAGRFSNWLKQKYDVTDKDIEYSSCPYHKRGKRLSVDAFTNVRKCDDYLYRDGKKRATINEILHDFYDGEHYSNRRHPKCFRLEYDDAPEGYSWNKAGLGDWNVYLAQGCKK